MPKIFGAKTLSADDIAGISGVINDAGTTGGTSTAYTATLASRPNPLTDGYAFVCVFNVTNGAAATIALSSGTAQPIWTNGAAAPAGAIIAGTPYVCRSDGTRVHLIGTLAILGTTKIGSGTGQITIENNYIYRADNTDSFYIGSGLAANIALVGDAAPGSNKGNAEYFTGEYSTAKHRFWDRNYNEQLRVDENGAWLACSFGSGIQVSAHNTTACGLFAQKNSMEFGLVMGTMDQYDGPQIYGYGNGYATTAYRGDLYLYPGVAGSSIILSAYTGGSTRYLEISDNGIKANCETVSIPTGGAWTTLCAIDGTQTLRFATVTAHGTILLEWDGTTLTKLAGAATLVVSGSPSGTEIGFRVSGGNLQASNGTGTSRNGSSGFSIQH